MSTDDEQRTKAINDLTRADRAKELLSNPLYVEAISSIEASMYAAFEDTKLDEEYRRHELWQRMQLMKQFRGKFEDIVKKGKKAEQTLTMLEKAKQLIGR
jgi:hypothetical protein